MQPIPLGGNLAITQPLTAYFEANQYYGPSPLIVDFDAASSMSLSGSIVSYKYEFGDGESLVSSSAAATHVYPQNGVYTAKLTVTNSNQLTAIFHRTITVGAANNPPLVAFTANKDFGTAPMTVLFDGSASLDVNGSIVKYAWSFGDEEVAEGPTATTSHVYNSPGVYLASLRVLDNDGDESTSLPQVLTVREFNMSPDAAFTCNRSSTKLSCSARQTSDLDGYIASYKWDFAGESQAEGLTAFNSSWDFSADGQYDVTLTVTDDSGATSVSTQSFMVDSSAPVIASFLQDNLLTKNSFLALNVNISDLQAVSSKIFRNGALVLETQDLSITESIQLAEGKNTIILEASDQSGNTKSVTLAGNIVLDSQAPILASISPADGSVISTPNVIIRGTFDEKVASADIDGHELTLYADKKSFSYSYEGYSEGEHHLNLSAIDLAGNTLTKGINFSVQLNILYSDLISVTMMEDGRLRVEGHVGATRGGSQVEVSGGFFNSEQTMSNPDGTFAVVLNYFTNANVEVREIVSGRTEAATIFYNADTTLSGIVKDTTGNPIPGVVVKIKDTDTAAVTTNASGVFTFSNPPTGDQQLILDGHNVPVSAVGETKKFSILEIPVSIASRQSNVLEKVIYLAPLMIDGSETIIAPDVDVIVTSPHTEGVAINIPGTVDVNFPEGNTLNAINLASVPKDHTTVPVLKQAEPDSVYALEPSGLSFSEPVELTLPNENEFPPKMQLMVYSKNSATGRWEIDGVARVSEDGNHIITEPGQGITHFSEVYAAPMGLKYSQVNPQDRPGADTFNGSVATTIDFPGYRALGQEIAPKLIYKSNWAYPTATVTNIFEIPDEVVIINSAGERVLAPSSSDLGYIKTWAIPEKIDVDFIAGDYHSPKMSVTGIPHKSVVSLGMDFSQQATGVMPFAANYEIHLKRMVVRTELKGRGGLTSTHLVVKETPPESFQESMTSELRGTLYIQNKKDSYAGKGWMIAGVQKIVNPGSERIMLEEGDGAVSTYVVNNKIQTLAKFDEGFAGISLANDSSVYVAALNNKMYQVDLEHASKAQIDQLPSFSGIYRSSSVYKRRECINWTKVFGKKICINQADRFYCQQKESNYKLKPTRNYPIGGVNSFYIASEKGLITDLSNGNIKIAGKTKTAPNSLQDPMFCSSEANCTNQHTVSTYWVSDGICGPTPESTGLDYDNDVALDGSALSAKFMNIKSMVPSPTSNVIAIADYGSHQVRQLNLDTKEVTTIVGNKKLDNSGLGGPAINYGLYHPQGLVYDEDGNLYVSTENGRILKVSRGGVITHFAGNPNGVLYDEAPATEMYLSRPYGMAIDHLKSYLYVADTGNNRIIRIDLLNNKAKTVVGNGLCQTETTTAEYGSALGASLCNPEFVLVDKNHNLIIADTGHKTIRRVIFADSDGGVLKYDSVAEDNSTLIKNDDRSFTRILRNGAQMFFDHTGKHLKTRDLVGLETKFEYDGDGKLLSQVDPVGGEISYEYGATGGRLSSIRYETDGREFHLNYSLSGELSKITYPDGTSKEFDYTPEGLLASEKDQRQNATQYVYNEWKRLYQVVRPDGKRVTINDSQSATMVNNFTGGNSGSLKKLGAHQGEASESIKDPRGNSTVMAKDGSGYVNTIIDSEGKTTVIERDLKGRPIKITRPDLSYAELVYDRNTGDLLSKFDSLTDKTEHFRYNIYGQLIEKTDGLGRKLINEYNLKGLLERTINNVLGTSVTYSYNGLGLLVEQTNSMGQTSTMSYDGKGNLLTSTNAEGKSTQFDYSPSGFVQQIIDPNQNRKTYNYDSMNRLIGVVDGNNKQTQYEYLATGELSRIIDPLNNQTIFEYNNLGLLTQKTSPGGELVQLSYDANGNLATELSPNGHLKQFQYDSLDRMTRKILPDDEYSFHYDTRGNLTSVANNASQIDFSYQAFDQGDLVASVHSRGLGNFADLPDTTISYTYNEAGERIQTNTPVGNFSYERDDAGRLRKIVDNHGKVFNFTYDLNQRLKEVSNSAFVTTYEFDATGFNTKINYARTSGATIERFIYGRDLIGNRISKTTTQGTSQYAYDQNYQLVQSVTPDLPQENFAYDSLGNRTQDNHSTYEYDSQKQKIVSDWKYHYAFDQGGNLISKQEKNFAGNSETFEYSSENQLRRFKLFKQGVLARDVIYTYDALGRRVEKEIVDHELQQTTVRRFGYDGQEILAEYDGTNQSVTTYTHSTLRTDDALALHNSSGTYYLIKDSLGSITDITNEGGFKVQHHTYSSFGKLEKVTDQNGTDISASPIVVPYLTYTGREYDKESGLYYYRARYYDPNSGRFLTPDPHQGILTIPGTFNSSYTYVLNNPARYTDPDGRIIPVLIAAAVIGGLANAYFNQGNGKGFLTNFAVGALVGAGSAAVGIGVGYAVGAWVGGGLAGAAVGGAAGGAASSIFAQLVTTGSVNWSYVALGAAFGAISGVVAYGISQGSSSAALNNTAEVIDTTNKSAAQSIIEGANGNPAQNGSPAVVPPSSPNPNPPLPGPIYVPGPM